ncbi:Hpt domain-containing protein [Maribacter algarum]|uniref:Hpt domain-containing protein n=1 Tax=Maribacter algarum (ex Zhang et al. 2020) TaxID=2578118 RepID=A0A5S3PTU6_9FLAO|nr:Hpt domain-containing protein [Maribacter algarum]TMM58360.1 Hpt domain-containing protein [Maribacter algarum]
MKEAPNLSYLEEIAGQDNDFEQRFIKLFKEEFLWEVGMYLRYIQKNEPRSAAEIVTKSKYKFSILGLENSYDFANTHEENLQQGDTSMHYGFQKILKKVNLFLSEV